MFQMPPKNILKIALSLLSDKDKEILRIQYQDRKKRTRANWSK